MGSEFLGVTLALASALIWGGGDFSGGLASRKAKSLHVLIIGGLAALVFLILLTVLFGEGIPSVRSLGFGALAGLCGMAGLAALYHGLSTGRASLVAPVSTLVAQAIPVLYSIIEGKPPTALKLAGFALAALGIWLVSKTDDNTGDAKGALWASLRLALIAGGGFGIFFVLASLAEARYVFGTLVAARLATIGGCLMLLALRRERIDRAAVQPLSILSGVLDASGNALFLLSKQYVSLGVASVLSSLYPVSTILLSRVIQHEHIGRIQWAGIALCAVAVGLIVV
jgi:drug/metabolite transporter (DMT)-like permease